MNPVCHGTPRNPCLNSNMRFAMMNAFPSHFASARHGIRLITPLAVLIFIFFTAARAEAQGIPSSAWWPEYHHDSHRTGFTPLPGRIEEPVELWSYYLGAPSADLVTDATAAAATYDLDGRGGQYRVQTTTTSLIVTDAASGAEVWRRALTPYFNGYSFRVGKTDPSIPGLQVAVWPATWFESTHEGNFGYLFGFGDGVAAGRELWQVELSAAAIKVPNLLIADIDHDGIGDVVSVSWGLVTVWDGASGRLRYKIETNPGRNYGMAAAVNVDDDPYQEIVILADYVPHVDLVDIEGPNGEGRLAWSHSYTSVDMNEAHDVLREVILLACPRSIMDLDGDGQVEIVYNLYNYLRDGKWHALILNARDGSTRLDLPDCFVWGVEDLDQDEVQELLAVETKTVNPKAHGSIFIANYENGALRERWRRERSFYLRVYKPNPLPSVYDTQLKEGPSGVLIKDIDGDGQLEFFIESVGPDDNQPVSFSACTLRRDAEPTLNWQYEVEPGEVLDPRAFVLSEPSASPAMEFCELTSGDVLRIALGAADAPGISRQPRAAVGGFSTTVVAADRRSRLT